MRFVFGYITEGKLKVRNDVQLTLLLTALSGILPSAVTSLCRLLADFIHDCHDPFLSFCL